jgi:hypothetical protein
MQAQQRIHKMLHMCYAQAQLLRTEFKCAIKTNLEYVLHAGDVAHQGSLALGSTLDSSHAIV